MERCQRVGADPDVEGRCILKPPSGICAPVTKLIRAELEGNCLRLSRLESNALKALQLTPWTRITAIFLMDVELHHFIPGEGTAVRYIHSDSQRVADLHWL